MNRSLSKYLLPALLAGAPLVAQAQDDHGHDHDHPHGADGHTHEAPAKGAKEEGNVDFFWRKSDEAFHKGDYPRAVMMHRAIVALSPDDTESWSVAAWLLWSMGKGPEAAAHIERGLKANPKSPAMWNEAAQHFELQKIAPRALDAYKNALALFPEGGDKQELQMLRRRLAHAAERGGDLDLSVETWRGLVRDYPDEVVNKNNLARVEAKANEGKGGAAVAALGAGALLASSLLVAGRRRAS